MLAVLVSTACSTSGIQTPVDPIDPTDPGPVDPGGDPVDPGPVGPGTPGTPDYSNIAQIQRTNAMFQPVAGGWEAPWTGPDAIGQAFYATHADEYDFLVVYTEEEVPDAYAWAVKYDYTTGGLGDDWPNGPSPADAGSAGRLDQVNMMTWTGLYAYAPDEASIVVHETTHRWAAFTTLPGGLPLAGQWHGHWGVYASTGGPSAVGYGDLTDLGNGRFRFDVQYPLQLSPLELYLAGLIPASQVPTMFSVTGANAFSPSTPEYEPSWNSDSYGEDVEFSGNRVDFGVSDIIAANGPRTPAFGQARSDFRFAFALVCESTCDASDLAIVEAQRVAFEEAWFQATDGLSTADTTL